MRIGGLIYPILLVALGACLIVLDLLTTRNIWVEVGASLTLLAGVVALLLRSNTIDRRIGLIIGLVCTAAAILLALRNYRSIMQRQDASSSLFMGGHAYRPAVISHPIN